jgi:hypothetical protein
MGSASTVVVLELDHVLIAVADLATAARELDARYGLASVEGGRHPDWGTANCIVPLGDAYLELITIVDAARAAESVVGRWVATKQPGLGSPLGWSVRTEELDDIARTRGLTVAAGSRLASDGRSMRWRMSGLEQAAAEPSLPFFIQWNRGTRPPGSADAAHRAGPVRLARLELAGDAGRVAGWLGRHRLPIAVRAGVPAVTSIILTGAAGEFALELDRF